MMRKILKMLLYVLLACLVFVTVWLFGAYEGWPLWVSLLAGAAATVLAFSLGRIRREVRRWQEVRRLRASAALEGRAARLHAIRTLFRSASETIRSARVSGERNPLSHLPFFLVMGPGGSGKTSLLLRSRVTARFRKESPEDEVPPTETVDFFFQDRAILLDTSGRYAEVRDKADYDDEWEQVGRLARRMRRFEPINGVIVAVSVEDLWTKDPAALSNIAQNVRQRIDRLMKATKNRIPVYVMVTKLDQLGGFRAWFSLLSEDQADEEFGYSVKGTEEFSVVSERTFEAVLGRIRSVSLLRSETMGISTEALVFSRELQKLHEPLDAFLKGLFEQSLYLEIPTLRGIFFSSGEDHPWCFSRFLKGRTPERAAPPPPPEIVDAHPEQSPVYLEGRSSTMEEEEGLAVRSEIAVSEHFVRAVATDRPHSGAFIRNFFLRVLPGERGQYYPIGLLGQWRKWSDSLVLVGWYALNAGLAGYLFYSFLTVSHEIRTIRAMNPQHLLMGSGFRQDLENLEQERDLIREMTTWDAGMNARFLAYTSSLNMVEDRIKKQFALRFGKYLSVLLDAELGKKVDALLVHGNDPMTGTYAEILVRRINLLKARQEGKGYPFLRTLPEPASVDVLSMDPNIPVEEADLFGDLYVADAAWEGPDSRTRDLHFLQSLLLEIELKRPNFSWLVDWANRRDLSPVTYADFWRGTLKPPGEETVPPAYTRAGMADILSFLTALEAASPPSFNAPRHAAIFLERYRTRKEDVWLRFVRHFSEGENTLADSVQWKREVHTVGTSRNPYFLLIDRIGEEFPEADRSPSPEWISLVRAFRKVETSNGDKGFLSRVSTYADILNSSGRKSLTASPGQAQRYFVSMVRASKWYRRYVADLAAVKRESLKGRGHAYQVSADFYGYSKSQAIKASSLVDAERDLEGIRKALVDSGDPDSILVGTLVAGPFGFALDYVGKEAACELQDRWTANVVYPGQAALTSSDLDALLFSSSGTVPKFMDASMSPFVRKESQGYRLVSKDGHAIPLSPDFIPYVNTSLYDWRSKKLVLEQTMLQKKENAVLRTSLQQEEQANETKLLDFSKKQFPVSIQSFPTDVDPSASARPYLTRLVVDCAQSSHVINNYNLPVRSSWNWSPEVCGAAKLTIRIGTLTLVKHYPGKDGFASFIEDFFQGHHRFTPRDFPLRGRRLRALGVSRIDVRFNISGAHAVLSFDRDYRIVRDDQKRVEQKLRNLDRQMTDIDHKEIVVKMNDLRPHPFSREVIPGRIAFCWSILPEGRALPGQLPGVSTEVPFPGTDRISQAGKPG